MRDNSQTTLTCSWCHRPNTFRPGQAPVYCPCGHRADAPRSACDCARCTRAVPHVEVSEADVADALARLRRGSR